MYNNMDLSNTNAGLMVGSLLPVVDYKEAFFQDLKDSVEPLVRNSIFLYLAYEAKAVEAAKYREDPKADVPFLKREAELRGVPLKDLVTSVEEKGVAFKNAISEMELLRIDYNLRYSNITEHQERLYLRDEFISKIRETMGALQ